MVTSSSDAWQHFLASLAPQLVALHEKPPEDVLDLGDGRSLSVEQLFVVLSQQVARPSGSVQREVREDRQGAALLARAWRHAVFDQARAVLVLREVELLREAQANARTCLEHAIALRRLAQAADEGRLEPLMEEIAFQAQRRGTAQLNYLDELDDDNGGLHRTLLRATRTRLEADQVPRGSDRPQTRTAKALFDGVPGGRHLYDVYSRLSENTHAGLGSAADRLPQAMDADDAVHLTSAPIWAEVAALLCWSCWAAEDAMRRFVLDGDDLAARQAELLGSIGIAPG